MISAKSKALKTIFIACIYIFVFQELLQDILPFFQYFDEMYSLMAIPLLVKKRKQLNNLFRKNGFALATTSIFLALLTTGTMASMIYNYQGIEACIYDFIAIIKFPLAILTTWLSFNSDIILENKTKIAVHIRIITILLTLLTIANYSFGIFDGSSRYGMIANQLFYSHPAKLVMATIYLMIMNIITSTKKVDLATILLLIINCTALRAKGIGFCIALLFVKKYVFKHKKKLSITKLGAIAAVVLCLIFNQISVYYIDNASSPRLILANKAIEIAKDHSPIGAGLSTFGSSGSETFYSPLYYKYNMSNIYGFTKQHPEYICDTFWPMVLAEFGYVGIILYALFIVKLFLEIQKMDVGKNKELYIAKILCLVYLIISSTSETAFVNPVAVSLATIIGVNTHYCRERINEE